MKPVAVEKILLLAVLALSGCVRAARGEVEPECETERMPKIAVKTTSMETFEEPWSDFEAPYADDVILICSAGDALSLRIQKGERNLGMNRNGTYLTTKELNNTTIRYEIRRPNVGRYRYRCVDTISRCEDNLYLVIKPVMSVISSSVHHKVNEDGMPMYFVPLGETYQILCTGSDVESLSIENTRTFEKLVTKTVNETTVSHKARASVVGVTYCACTGKETQWLVLIVGYPLEAQQFQCTSYNWNKIACSWRSSGTTNTFNIYYTDPYGGTQLLCFERLDGINRACTWNNKLVTGELILGNDDYPLVMQTCNDIFCNNQTFGIKHVTIMKLEPVAGLRVLNLGPRTVNVIWGAHEDNWLWKYVYRVEYRLLASRWRQVNASSVQCSHIECGTEVNLECSDHHYELRVFVRLQEAVEERLWSEPTSMYFFTSSQVADYVMDPVCRAALQEPEPITSSEAALSEIGKLIRHTLIKKTVLKKQIHGFQPKLAKIKALTDFLASSSN